MKKHEITEMTIAMRTGNLKMENDGDYWSDEDRRKLSDRFYAGASYNEIALELGRTEPAVQQQIEQMQLYVKSTRAPRKRCPAAQAPKCLCSVCTLDRSQCPRCEHYLQNQEVE